MKLKSKVVALFLLAMAGSAQAYTFKIKNETGHKINVELRLALAGAPKPKFTLEPGQTRSTKVGGIHAGACLGSAYVNKQKAIKMVETCFQNDYIIRYQREFKTSDESTRKYVIYTRSHSGLKVDYYALYEPRGLPR